MCLIVFYFILAKTSGSETNHSVISYRDKLLLPMIVKQPLVSSESVTKTESELKLPKITQNNEVNQTNNSPTRCVSPTNPESMTLKKPCLNTGWGRAHKKAINKWYQSLGPLEFASFLTQYPKRFKWCHRDVFRLSHFKSENVVHNMLVIYATRGFEAAKLFFESLKDNDVFEHSIANKGKKVVYKISAETRHDLTSVHEYLSAFESLRSIADEAELTNCVKKFAFRVDQVLSLNKNFGEAKKATQLWLFYAKNDLVPLTQIVKSLCFLSRKGLMSYELVETLCAKFKDKNLIQKEKLHPLSLFTVYKIYNKGNTLANRKKFVLNDNLNEAL